jgi:predicted transcriptional regulator
MEFIGIDKPEHYKRLEQAHNAIISRYYEKINLERLKNEILEEVLKSLDVKIEDNATPALKELDSIIRNLGK